MRKNGGQIPSKRVSKATASLQRGHMRVSLRDVFVFVSVCLEAITWNRKHTREAGVLSKA